MTAAVLFILFNRPETTLKVFEAIKASKPKRLYIAADGPRKKNYTDISRCEQARKIVAEIDWPCEVKRLYRDKNLGCKLGVSSAIDWFFDNEEEGIILEDDVVPHPDFFTFCTFILDKYRFDQRVMMATGTNYLGNQDRNEDYFFSQHFTIWGWATWRRAWKLYDVKMSLWENRDVKKNINYKFLNSYIAKHFENTFDSLSSSYIDTWDIQWVFNCLYNSGLCATPRTNLITNIGVDGVHSNTKTDAHFLEMKDLKFTQVDTVLYPVAVDSKYDLTLHELKTRPALKRAYMLNLLKRFRLYNAIKSLRNAIKKFIIK